MSDLSQSSNGKHKIPKKKNSVFYLFVKYNKPMSFRRQHSNFMLTHIGMSLWSPQVLHAEDHYQATGTAAVVAML